MASLRRGFSTGRRAANLANMKSPGVIFDPFVDRVTPSILSKEGTWRLIATVVMRVVGRLLHPFARVALHHLYACATLARRLIGPLVRRHCTGLPHFSELSSSALLPSLHSHRSSRLVHP